MVWLSGGEKKFEDFEQDGQTDRHRATAYAMLMHSAARQNY